MILAHVERLAAHSDLRTFECAKCEHVQKLLVEDPLKSGYSGWTNSELAPPK